MSWRPISSTYLKPDVVTSAVGGVLPSRIALVAVVVPWKTRSTSAGARPARASTLRTAVMKPASSAPGVEGVFATQRAPVAASVNVMSVKVPPTSMASVQVLVTGPPIVDLWRMAGKRPRAQPTGRPSATLRIGDVAASSNRMEFKDYYKTLGVARTADDKAIKTAYRRLARRHHPDVNKGKADRFKEISEAYTVLSDPEKRKRYDTLGPDWERYAQAGAGAGAGGRSPFEGRNVRFSQEGDAGGFSDFFRTIFSDLGGFRRGQAGGGATEFDFSDVGDLGGGFGPVSRGHDVEAGIELTLEEAFQGAKKTIALELDEPCPQCGGSGNVNRRPCPRCRGGGWTKSTRNLEVKIPAGVDTGSRMRMASEGVGGGSGDRGSRGDLYLPVTVAALGGEVSVPTLKGQVSMKIPAETSSGKTVRLPGYGMPRLKGGGVGDQFVRVQITIPTGLGPREKELFQELKKLRPET